MKRASMIIALLLVVVVGAFALDATVTWHWGQNDPDVKFFRHQIDGENAENWTVVSSDVLEASYDIDVSVEHVFYLQQSYDGENWSASSSSVLAAVKEAEEVAEVVAEQVVEEPVVAEPIVEEASQEVVTEEVEDVEEPVVEVAQVVEEEPVVEPVVEPVASEDVEVEPVSAPVVVKNPAKSRVNLGVSYTNNIAKFSKEDQYLGLSLDYTFLFGRKGSFGMGVKAQLSASTTLAILKNIKNVKSYSDLALVGSLDVLAVLDYATSWGDVYLGLGAKVKAPISSLESIKTGFVLGATAQLGARLRLGNLFGLGIELADAYYLYPSATAGSSALEKNETTGRVYLSFEF